MLAELMYQNTQFVGDSLEHTRLPQERLRMLRLWFARQYGFHVQLFGVLLVSLLVQRQRLAEYNRQQGIIDADQIANDLSRNASPERLFGLHISLRRSFLL
jgi:hypothetical protein